MKIAISGSHAVGKSTLVEALAAALPSARHVPEPYQLLLDDGHVFADPPVVDDFEAQLEISLLVLDEAEKDAIFERSPADFLAYLAALDHPDGESSVARHWNDVATAMKGFDLVVYVPVERRDRIQVPASEYPRLRRRADRMLRELLVEDGLGSADRVLEVNGSVEDRLSQVLARLASPLP